MKLGILGLKNSGKTTIFNALTGLDAEITPYSLEKAEPNLGMAEVLDERITKLAEMYQPQKIVYANIEYIDFAGLSGNKNESLSANLVALAKTTDAIALVVRNFDNNVISETLGDPNPLSDINMIIPELIISDLIIAEKRLANIELSMKRGIKEQALNLEKVVIELIIKKLNEEIPISEIKLSEQEKKAIKGFQFITQKPFLIIVNSDENNFGNNEQLLTEIGKKYKVIEFAGNFEMELNSLSTEDAQDFMKDINIQQSARDRLTKLSYELLQNISFFTVGKDEVRAWTIVKGSDAVEAAGKIHSDLARGFIRAECFSFENLIDCGNEKKLREKGLFRLEGKKYIVQDGDILGIRFSV